MDGILIDIIFSNFPIVPVNSLFHKFIGIGEILFYIQSGIDVKLTSKFILTFSFKYISIVFLLLNFFKLCLKINYKLEKSVC